MAFPFSIGERFTGTAAQRAAMNLMPAFLTDPQKARLAKIRKGRQLYNGQWRQFLLTDGNTAHLFKALRNAAGEEKPLLVTVNVLGLAARKTADLLMLDPPRISAPEGLDAQADALKAIHQASDIEAVLYEGALAATYEAEAWLQVMRHDGRTLITGVPADMCFPVGDLGPDGCYAEVEKVWVETRGTASLKRHYLRKEIHTAGLIRNALYVLSPYGQVEGDVDLGVFYGTDAPPPQMETGVDEILLDHVPNFRLRGASISDFEGVDELVDQFTAAVSQAAIVIAKHADPKIGLPVEAFDADGKYKASDDAFAFASKDDSPYYLVWNAQLDAAIKMIEMWLDWLLVVIEMSPGLLGLRKGAAPDAYKKLRLEAVNTLAKVARKKLYWTRFLADVHRRAHKLDNASPGTRYDHDAVNTEWHDGIPVDESERIDAVVNKRLAGLLDRRTAVEDLEGVENAASILERLETEDAAASRVAMNLTERERT